MKKNIGQYALIVGLSTACSRTNICEGSEAEHSGMLAEHPDLQLADDVIAQAQGGGGVEGKLCF